MFVIRKMGAKALIALVAMFLILGCSPQSGLIRELPCQLHVEDTIDSFDFVIDENQLTHLIWVAKVHDPSSAAAGSEEQLWYLRGDMVRGKWDEPRMLATAPLRFYGPPIRIIEANHGLHVFAGHEMLHLHSGDRGETWNQVEPLLRHDELARSYDVWSKGDTLVLAYVSNNPMSSGGLATDSVEIWVTRLFNGAGVRSHVASLSQTQNNVLTLLSGEGDLYLFCGIHQLRHSGGVTSPSGHLLWSRSEDWGRTWSIPAQGPELQTSYFAGMAAVRDSAFTVFYSAPILTRARMNNAGLWSVDQYIAMHSTLLDYTNMKSVIIAERNGRGYLIWIDDRYARRDWVLDLLLHPRQWANNDVEYLKLDVATRMGAEISKITPSRLTADLSMATMVRAVSRDNRVYVMWAGRSKVGRSPESAHRPPEFFYTSLPLDN